MERSFPSGVFGFSLQTSGAIDASPSVDAQQEVALSSAGVVKVMTLQKCCWIRFNASRSSEPGRVSADAQKGAEPPRRPIQMSEFLLLRQCRAASLALSFSWLVTAAYPPPGILEMHQWHQYQTLETLGRSCVSL